MLSEHFSNHEQLIFNALAKHASSTGTASGHHIRKELLAAGLNKKEIGHSMGALVEKGLLERVKVIDTDGMFYMAYRRTPTAV